MIRCPNCGADEVSKLSTHYRRNLPALDHHTEFIDRIPAADSGADALAESFAPPRKASYLFIFLVCQAFIWFAVLIGVSRWYLIIWASGWMIATLVLWVGAYRHNTYQWPRKMQTWRQTYVCHRCGIKFKPEADVSHL